MAATNGQWNDVWDSFDKRQKAKIGPTATDALDAGMDMFWGAGRGG